MIHFSCSKCGKEHSASDSKAGRRGLCGCGTVMLIPEIGSCKRVVQTLGRIDLHADDRHAMYLAIGGTLSGIVIVAVVVYLLFFHDAWESDNLRRLLHLKNEADALVQANEYEKARAKYDELFGVLGNRDVQGEYLRGEIERARIASAENNKEVEPILAARADTERKKQAADDAATAAEAARRFQPGPARIGRVNYSLVEAFKSSWRSEGWKHKPRQEQAKALALMVLLVENDCPELLEREATLDYIQRNIDSW